MFKPNWGLYMKQYNSVWSSKTEPAAGSSLDSGHAHTGSRRSESLTGGAEPPPLETRGLLQAVHAANAQVRDEAARWKDVAFVDVATPMLDASGQPRRELFLDDGLHLNAQGYALWRQVLAPRLQP